MKYWQTTRFRIDLSQPKVMGIVNLTPDSFSDGGQYSGSLKMALAHAEKLLQNGADILDIGGESTRPNAAPVSLEAEWQRLQPVLAELVKWHVPLSIDTRRSEIMRQVLDNGYADIINDVQGLEDKGALALLAQHPNTGICLMHMRGLPENMQHNPDYGDVVQEVAHYLQGRVDTCIQAGIAAERMTLDPGFGFGKTLQHNIALMQNLNQLHSSHRLPLLIGVSRKRMIGELTGREIASERVSGSLAAALMAVHNGAKIIRVHDVRETADALKVWLGLNVSSH
ncbi:MAG: dihydropteroate synthase [Alysiella sp.]|uniref:dihydropteroate synthase n=1 Tax=Alysiella sp. TaxID=1872483 RepID=UPI0026DC20DB|nr:dihydropteroate synthase [Alysiella sp.]MDO4434133.1 dihydropteroate synthase [Alysiella sp.]